MHLYQFIIQEQIGEKEWTHHHLLNAISLNEARAKAEEYASKYWAVDENESADKNGHGWYEFNDGEILVRVEEVRPITKEKFLREAFERALIKDD